LPETDNHIIEALRHGNVRRFGELMDRHKDRALTLAFRLVNDRQVAEELVQDAFVRVYRNLDSFRGEAKFSTWFYRILYNVCMTRVTRTPLRDMLTDPMEEGNSDADMPQSADPSVLDQIEKRETIAMLHEELGRIPTQYRVALTLFYVQEMSHEEMAAVLQMPIGTIKTNLSRGRTALRERVLQRLKSEEVAR
jgi:RNA polymerase sigma-70 factor (ECF subfamily)